MPTTQNDEECNRFLRPLLFADNSSSNATLLCYILCISNIDYHREVSKSMPSPKEKLQGLLGELFQFGSADLDFGIYRIMNFKRDAIERFIRKDLIEAVDKELSSGMLASQSQAVSELKEVAAQIRETLGETALNGDGSLEEAYHGTPLGKHYLELQARASQAQERPAFEATIFNHLYAFFSRYYDNGDFLSKRRYSRREKYAVPYNGEEVYLHWANNDQYYVKTGEYFNDYRFKSPYGINVHFMLIAADVEKDNVKGDKRFFVPLSHEVTFDAEKKGITIPFQYRPLTEQEEIKWGQRNQQDVIIKEALNTIPAELQKSVEALPALLSSHHTTTEGPVSFLEHHLRRYTRRNTSDFFVHKDLKGFLTRELDFYLKNEVLNLDEVEAAGEPRSEAWFQIMHVIRSIGSRVIEFLAQIEDFQKRLFEKKKFILETQYCITMANVPEDFYPEIAECTAQWEEWKELLHLDEERPNLFTSAAKNQKERRIAALKEHPTLVLDTKHFDQRFKNQLLASYDNVDEITDALLVHGENLQALNLLAERYHEKISCIHIDPPYNTQTSGFLYKNDYQHSSWLAMMEDRICASINLMSRDGSYLCHIDENEHERLQLLFERFTIPDAGTVTWDKKNPMNAGRGIATQHEYIVWRTRQQTPIYLRNKNIITMLKKAAEIVNKHGTTSKEAQSEYAAWINSNSELSGGEKAYRYLDEEGRPYQSVSLRAPEPRTNSKFHEPLIHPVTKKPCPVPPNGFSRTPETLQDMVNGGEIIFGPDETTQPRQKVLLTNETRRQISSMIQDGHKGKADLAPLGLDFPYCHPVSLYELLIGTVAQSLTGSDIVLDHFAGSGTSGHAVINLNREDRSRRRVILVEMDDCFDTVLIPRIKKMTYTPVWKNSKPIRLATAEEAEYSLRIMKYVRLESYDDALNNITFPDAPKTLYDFDDYLLKYMLAWETKESETLLNVEKLSRPFSYKLTITGGEEIQEKPVDIPETFSYLLGLNIKTRRVYQNKERFYLVYRGTIDHREVAIIWRETSGWEKEDYEQDKKFVEGQKLTEGVDEVFVNGDSYIPKARALESVFKSRMFGRL